MCKPIDRQCDGGSVITNNSKDSGAFSVSLRPPRAENHLQLHKKLTYDETESCMELPDELSSIFPHAEKTFLLMVEWL